MVKENLNMRFQKLLLGTALIAALAALGACTKVPGTPWGENEVDEGQEEVAFRVQDEADTKATPVSSLSNAYWCTTTGGNAVGSASESDEWNAGGGSPVYSGVSAGVIYTGQYVDGDNPGTRNYYCSNVSFNASTRTLSATNDTDIVAGRTFGSSSTSPSVNLLHIFARMGTLTMNAPAGYSIDNISWTIQGYSGSYGTSGTYNLQTSSWSGCSGLTSATSISSGSDLYVIPGVYTIVSYYRLGHGGDYENKSASANITIARGCVNNITATAVGAWDVDVTFSVDIADWYSTTYVSENS